MKQALTVKHAVYHTGRIMCVNKSNECLNPPYYFVLMMHCVYSN